jgi:hypothetical protein
LGLWASRHGWGGPLEDVGAAHLRTLGRPTWGRWGCPLGDVGAAHLGTLGLPTWGRWGCPLGDVGAAHLRTLGLPTWGQPTCRLGPYRTAIPANPWSHGLPQPGRGQHENHATMPSRVPPAPSSCCHGSRGPNSNLHRTVCSRLPSLICRARRLASKGRLPGPKVFFDMTGSAEHMRLPRMEPLPYEEGPRTASYLRFSLLMCELQRFSARRVAGCRMLHGDWPIGTAAAAQLESQLNHGIRPVSPSANRALAADHRRGSRPPD